MEFIRVHQVLDNVEKHPERFFINVKLVNTTPEEIEAKKDNTDPDVPAARLNVESPEDHLEIYYRIKPAFYSYHRDLAKAKYGFVPSPEGSGSYADHLLYVPADQEGIKIFKNAFEKVKEGIPQTTTYINKMFRDIDRVIISGKHKLAKDDLEAIINL